MWLFIYSSEAPFGRFLRTLKAQTDRLRNYLQRWIVLPMFCMFGTTSCSISTFVQSKRRGQTTERSRVSRTNQPTNLWHLSRAAGNNTAAQFFLKIWFSGPNLSARLIIKRKQVSTPFYEWGWPLRSSGCTDGISSNQLALRLLLHRDLGCRGKIRVPSTASA